MNVRNFDHHIHVETAEATPAHALTRLRELGFCGGLVDHVFKDRNRITPAAVKSECRKTFATLPYVHGCEADVFGEGAIAVEEGQLEQMDFVLLSFTHIGQPGVLDDIALENNDAAVAARLLLLLEAAVRCPFAGGIVHPFAMDLPEETAKSVYKAIGQKKLREIIRFAATKGIPFEVNARTLRRLPAGPQCQFLREAFAGGCRFTIGSDAHCLADIGRTSEAWALIDALGIPKERIGKPVLLKDKKLFS